MSDENLMCQICGGLHPAGHQDKELEQKLEAITKLVKSPPPYVYFIRKLEEILGIQDPKETAKNG